MTTSFIVAFYLVNIACHRLLSQDWDQNDNITASNGWKNASTLLITEKLPREELF